MAEPGYNGAAGGERGVPGASFRGHESVCDSCEEGYYHAEGHSVGEEDSGGVGGAGLMRAERGKREEGRRGEGGVWEELAGVYTGLGVLGFAISLYVDVESLKVQGASIELGVGTCLEGLASERVLGPPRIPGISQC